MDSLYDNDFSRHFDNDFDRTFLRLNNGKVSIYNEKYTYSPVVFDSLKRNERERNISFPII